MQLFPIGKVYNFMGQRRLLSLVSLVMVAGSIFGLFQPGPRLGTDFKGGTEIELAFKKPVEDSAIREAVKAAGFSSPDVIRVEVADSANRFLIRVQEVSTIGPAERLAIEQALCFGDKLDESKCPEGSRATEVKFSPGGEKISIRYRQAPNLARVRTQLSAAPGGLTIRDGAKSIILQNAREHKVEVHLKSKGDQLMDGLRAKFGNEVVPARPLRVEWVGPKAGALLRDAAIKSMAIALIFVMVYIAFRFDLRFAPGAVLALIHDALVTLGILVFLQKEISLTTVAALLTIVGYSVNDTVVVYDRVRENLGKLRGTGFIKIINISLSEMLSRTILTSSTTIFSFGAFFYWGTGAIKDFAFTLIVGLILGTYSSIYVALPLTHWLDRKFFTKADSKAERRPVRAKKAAAIV